MGPGPESAPRSAFWAILGTCLGVPQRVLFESFLTFFRPKNAKKHSKNTLWGTPWQVPKIAQKALRGALSGPGPKSTPVNGGRDRKNYQYSTERQKCHQNLAPVLVILSGTSLSFSSKIIAFRLPTSWACFKKHSIFAFFREMKKIG